MQQAKRTGKTVGTEIYSDIYKRWLLFRVYPYASGLSVYFQDISKRKESEQAMLLLSAIVENSTDAIFTKDLDGIVTSWNKGAETIYGYSVEEIVGKPITTIFPKDRLNEFTKIMTNIKKGIPIKHYETRRIHKNGAEFDVSITVSPMRDMGGKTIGASVIARDITDRKKTERVREEFLGIASHELKTPLTSIKSYVQLLARLINKKENEKVYTYLKRTDTYIDRLNSLIEDLLNMSRIQAGKLDLEVSEFDYDDFVQEVIDSIQPTSQHKIVLRGKTNTLYRGDKNRLEQVLTNLFTNAIKYSPDADRIIVKTVKKSGRVIVSVTDFGVGIPKKEQKELFKRFYRVPSTAKKFSGLGIGLYVSAEIVKRHKGKIWVKSEPGKGATFSFSLPIS